MSEGLSVMTLAEAAALRAQNAKLLNEKLNLELEIRNLKIRLLTEEKLRLVFRAELSKYRMAYTMLKNKK